MGERVVTPHCCSAGSMRLYGVRYVDAQHLCNVHAVAAGENAIEHVILDNLVEQNCAIGFGEDGDSIVGQGARFHTNIDVVGLARVEERESIHKRYGFGATAYAMTPDDYSEMKLQS